MRRSVWKQFGLFGSAAAFLAGCAQPASDQAFTVSKIDSLPSRKGGGVRIKLSTPGNYAEADDTLVLQYAQVVAVREATARQRQIAVARGQAASRSIASQPKIHPHKARYLAVKTDLSPANESPTRVTAPQQKVRSHPTTATRAKASVMIWDTETQEIVGNSVYDLSTEPASGSVARFETYTAEYVGAGR